MAEAESKPTYLPNVLDLRVQLNGPNGKQLVTVGEDPPDDLRPVSIGVVRASWNLDLVDRLAAGVDAALADIGVTNQVIGSVPGCYELPIACQALAMSEMVEAIVAIGVVIRGETSHYELVSQAAATGLQRVQLEHHIAIGFGVLAVESREQALARSTDDYAVSNVGYDAAVAAITMMAWEVDDGT